MTFEEWWDSDNNPWDDEPYVKELARDAWETAGKQVVGVHYAPAPDHDGPPGSQRP